ncbi:MAG: VanZ family protein [Sphingobacteriales bacterium]|nr:MAG: VanZ family protein [Sphingobacteriales bacterium]
MYPGSFLCGEWSDLIVGLKRAFSKALFLLACSMRLSRSVRAIVALLYFATCCYLFFLPGDKLPKEDWLDKIYFDKWVHVGLFAVLLLLLCWAEFAAGRRQLRFAALTCIGYGLAVEVIQGLWIANRSADALDFISDSLGVLLGAYLWQRWGKKNRPL